MASPNVLASKQLRRSARLQNNSSGLSSLQNQPPLRTTSVAPLPPRPVVADGTARRRLSDASSSRRDGASGCAESAPPSPAPELEWHVDEGGRVDGEDKLLRQQFNEIYAPLLEKTRAKMDEYQLTGDERVEDLAKKFIACRLEQFKKKSIHQCTGSHQCDCSIGSGSGSVGGGSPNNLPQDYNEPFEDEGTESRGVEVEGVEAEGAEAEEDSPSDPSSNGEQEETSDDDEAIEGEEKWDLKEVIDMKGLRKKKPIRCQEEDCTSAACSAWVSITNPDDVWYGCIDHMQEYYEGWPSSDEMPVKYLTEEHRALLAEKCSMQENPPMPDLPTTEGDILADFVFIDEEDADDAGDTDEHCVYDADYCKRYQITSKWDIDWINLCHEEDMYSEANDTPDNWDRLHRIVEERRGKVVTKTYTFVTNNPLRMRWLRCKYHGSTIRSACTPHPPFNPHRDIKNTKLYDDVTVEEALPSLQRLAEETFLETGKYKAVLPRMDSGTLRRPVQKFSEEGGEYAKIAIAISKLKVRAADGSYIARLTLKYFEQKAGLCLDNQAAYDKYRGERGCDDGEVHWYLGILYRCAGIPLLQQMVKYDVIGEAEANAAEIIADPTNLALQPLLEHQAGVTSELRDKIYWVDRYRLHPDNNPSDCLIYKFFKSIWDGDCQHCIDNGVLRGNYRRSVTLSTLQHVGKAGRLAKQQMADGKDPANCSFEVLLSMDEDMVLMCGEHHMLEDCSLLARLASGESVKNTHTKTQYGWREVYRARILYLTMHMVSTGKSQLNPEDREWILSEASTLDKHHLTMCKNFIDKFGTEWETRKSPDLEGLRFMTLLHSLPEGEWQKFLVYELAICAITRRSDHALLHLVYGPNKVRGLSEYLGIILPWDETDTHIVMPRVEPPVTNTREIVFDRDSTELSNEHMRDMLRDTSDIILDDEQEEDVEEEDPEYARLSIVLNTLPMERLIARPCLGDDGGLAPQLLELWGRNSVSSRITTYQVGETPSTRLPFRMRSSRRRAELNVSSEEETEHSYAGLSLGPRTGDDDQNDVNSDHMEEGQQLVEGLQSSDNEELPMQGIISYADSDYVSDLEEPSLEEQQQLDDVYEQSDDDTDSDRTEEEQQSVGEEQSMELDESLEEEEEEEELQQLEQNDDETGGQLDDEQRLEQERLEDEQQLEQERKLGRRILKVTEAHERDATRAVGAGSLRRHRGRRRKGSPTFEVLKRLRPTD